MRARVFAGCALLAALSGCSSDAKDGTAGTGGYPGVGGTPGTGGALASGGAASGGAPVNGGAPASGGTVPNGGTVGSGGTSTGGTPVGGTGGGATGGTPGTDGGAPGTGGAGGTPTTGGAPGTGGAGGVALKADCTPDDLHALKTGDTLSCSSYVTPTVDGTGIKTQLGPYGVTFDLNVGKDFAIPPNAADTPAFCTAFAGTFGEDPTLTAKVLDLGNTDLSLYTVFKPANPKAGEKYPIITWGNGTCAQPGSYAALLASVASNGYFVVAANGRFVANGAQTKALDFMFAANDDKTSPYYQMLDTTKVGAMGHSQGSAATITAASDSRISAVILFNGGTSAVKKFLAVSGDRDIGNPTVASYQSGTHGSYLFFHKIPQTGGTLTGHLTLMMQPDRVIDPTVNWWQMTMRADATAKNMFVGSSCGLCNKAADFDYGEKGL
jgi:hypothetical protein